MRSRPAAILIALCLCWCPVALTWTPLAHADDRVDRMLELLRSRPAGMNVKTWQSQRREAVRELGRVRARKAVPPLLKIVASERFDVILEFAITALGNIGDVRARPALRKLEADTSLDKFVREAASSALRRIGDGGGSMATPQPRPRKPARPPRPRPRKDKITTPPGDRPPPQRPRRPRRPAPGEAFGALPAVAGEADPEVIFRARWWDLVAGTADVRWDGQVAGTRAGLTLGSRYLMQEERSWIGFSMEAAGHLGFQLANAPGAESTWELTHALQVDPEVRFYPFSALPLLFGQISGGAGYGLAHTSRPALEDSRLSVAGNLSVGAGPGYGRVVDAGPTLRLARISDLLGEAGLLTGAIPGAVLNRLMHAWYELRDRVGSYARLGHTLRILRQAKLLRRTPGPAVTYRLIRILEDPQLENPQKPLTKRTFLKR